MSEPQAIVRWAVLVSAVGLAVSSNVFAGAREVSAGLERFEEVKDQAVPAVCEMTGLSSRGLLKVDMITRAEVADFVRRMTALEYPGDELVRRGRCLAELGLLPKDYDLTEGLIGLVGEQAGAIYDPHGKTLLGISDLPPQLQAGTTQKMIVSHEVCHALQDRVIDIVARSRETRDDIDGEYAVRSVIEGMATVVMLAYCQGLAIQRVPDTRTTMRVGFGANLSNPNMKALAASPVYLRELLISPYAEGGAFAQAWLKANAGAKIGAMLATMPKTSEQVLHFDKYMEPDEPTPIDLSRVPSGLPPGWTYYSSNTLGEFDLRVLFGLYEETRLVADRAAAGWDGLRYEAYTDSQDRLLLVGASAWDSETDAEDFSTALRKVLAEVRDADDVVVSRRGAGVWFAVGATTIEEKQHVMQALETGCPLN